MRTYFTQSYAHSKIRHESMKLGMRIFFFGLKIFQLMTMARLLRPRGSDPVNPSGHYATSGSLCEASVSTIGSSMLYQHQRL